MGQLTPVEKLEGSAPYTSANLLPISNLGCNVDDMTLRITQNGRYLEFTRSNGETREVQGFNLPYQARLVYLPIVLFILVSLLN